MEGPLERRLRMEADRALRSGAPAPFASGRDCFVHLMQRALERVSSCKIFREWARRTALSSVFRHVSFAFKTLPSSFHGFRILHLSDVHFNREFDVLDALVQSGRKLDADLCVITGDFQTGYEPEVEFTCNQLERLVTHIRAPHGIYACLGNSDVYAFAESFEKLGVRLLVNESVEIQGESESMWLVGVDDPACFRCDDLPRAVQGVPADGFKILLAHAPMLVDEAAAMGIDLYLCGHTHGGQICVPYYGTPIYCGSCPRRYARGKWRHQNLQGYTSAGLGTKPFIARFWCPPEVVVIELCEAGQATCEPMVPGGGGLDT